MVTWSYFSSGLSEKGDFESFWKMVYRQYLVSFLYPPQNEVLGGYTVFSLSVIP